MTSSFNRKPAPMEPNNAIGRIRRFIHTLPDRVRQAIVAGIFLHLLIGSFLLAKELNEAAHDFPRLMGAPDEERRAVILNGVIDLIEDSRFIARCQAEIPLDAEVLVVSNLGTRVMILNYYLYPRKVVVHEEALGDDHWIVHYHAPKALGMNRIERPIGSPD